MAKKKAHNDLESQSLEGKLLIAMPGIGDSRFDKTIIYMCAHSAEGSMGIIINRPSAEIRFDDVINRLEDGEVDVPLLPHAHNGAVYEGGPVEPARGFVLHTSDYETDGNTMPIDRGICLTATLEVLRDIASGKGPRLCLLALGYAGWSPGQLEDEMQANGWLYCDADESLIFGADNEEKYLSALGKLGIDPGNLASEYGHA